MSLSRRERSRLRWASQELARSDPGLTAMFAIFGRLTAEEPLPGHEQRLSPAGLGAGAELPSTPPQGRAPHPTWSVLARAARAAAAFIAPRGGRARASKAAPGSALHAQEDRMSTTRHGSPLPPDHGQSGAGSPLPPDPRRGRGDSPLPPDPSELPTPAHDQPPHGGASTPGPTRPESDASR